MATDLKTYATNSPPSPAKPPGRPHRHRTAGTHRQHHSDPTTCTHQQLGSRGFLLSPVDNEDRPLHSGLRQTTTSETVASQNQLEPGLSQYPAPNMCGRTVRMQAALDNMQDLSSAIFHCLRSSTDRLARGESLPRIGAGFDSRRRFHGRGVAAASWTTDRGVLGGRTSGKSVHRSPGISARLRRAIG